jgi:hypothetical protein
MASGSLLVAEQCIDRQARTYLFRGRQIESVTARVLLHAIDSAGRPLCGCEHLTPTEQPWQASYLPHLPRCRGCAQRADAAADVQPGLDGDLPAAAAPASGVDIRTAHGTAAENDARAALREVLAEHDLRCWMFTDLVTIDETIRGGFSHPLTLSPAPLVRRPALALTMFLHEQLHWMEGRGTEAAAAEASRRWPDPPPPPAGAADPRSTWIHLSVCALEYRSLAGILGPAAAAAELRQHAGYSWIYGQILASPGWFPASFGAMASRCPGSLRFPAATSANRGGQAPERRPAPQPGPSLRIVPPVRDH